MAHENHIFPRRQFILLVLVLVNIGMIVFVSFNTNFGSDRKSGNDGVRRTIIKYRTLKTNTKRTDVRPKVIQVEGDPLTFKKVGGIGFTYMRPRSLGLTSPNTSDFELLNKSPIEVGGLIQLRINARDDSGRLRTSGGDFLSVVIIQELQNASTVARVVDHGNGSYTAHAYAGWAGKSTISVMLIHPSDAIYYLKYNYTLIDNKAGFIGIFQRENVTEKTNCFIQHEGSWERKCEYFHHGNLYSTRLLCDPPTTLPCDALAVLPRSDDTNALNMPWVPGDKKFLFEEKRRYQRILKGPRHVTVRGSFGQSSVPPMENCLTADESDPNELDGFWFRGRYLSLTCDNSRSFNMSDILECLRNKHLLLLGDSQLRLWIRQLKQLLHIEVQVDKYTHALFMSKPEINFNVTFQFHPFFRHPEEGYSRLSDHRYEIQILDETDRGHCNYIVVFGPWAHYALWTPAAYRERLEFLRDGILRFMKRCPEAVVILKGPQPTKTTITFFDYVCKGMMDMQREVFSGLGVKYMNVWDMIECAYWYQDPHPPDEVINVQFQQLMSYSCR